MQGSEFVLYYPSQDLSAFRTSSISPFGPAISQGHGSCKWPVAAVLDSAAPGGEGTQGSRGEGLSEKVTFEPKYISEDLGGKSIPVSGDSACKGPGVGSCLVCTG